MFTGIVQNAGKIESLEAGGIGGDGTLAREAPRATGARLRVRFAPELIATSPLTLGASIAVNGCCLTVIEFGNDFFVADLSPETLARTSFGARKPGDQVNLERPLKAGDELGGHMVQGHVDGVGRVQSIFPADHGPVRGVDPNDSSLSPGNNWWLNIAIPPEIAPYVAEKGSLTVDGISLTAAQWSDGIAGIAVIPFTYQHTHVKFLAAGDAVNLECDILAKYVEQALSNRVGQAASSASRISLQRLISEGF